ncbi:hypothetical protein [Oligoflexus tunisiensis]|uniref:hypothetical protein n=1 Tax=Oligoflexus tunisiensis TaxID=708132 RepID=UPI00114CA867|nr:hypothetical protein [Oligoflexus tunisiensis]
MKRTVLAALAALGLTACAEQGPETSDLKIDSAHSIGVDGVITNGVIRTTATSDSTITRQIRSQLNYMTGQLNGISGGADLNRLELTINEKIPQADGSFEVHYAAKVLVAWRRDRTLPDSYELILPARGDSRSMRGFVTAFQDACAASSAHDVSTGNFWYYYRPQPDDCQLLMSDPAHAALVSRFAIHLNVSAENTEGKAPEYAKIWEDDRAVITAVFGKYEDGATSNRDAGIAAYNEMYSMLRSRFGEPAMQDVDVPEGTRPGVDYPAIHMIFNTPEGTLDVDILLIDGILSADETFKARYNERTKISDLVSYNGHSGLGANIRALARMGSFQTGQYQLFFVNGCDTFAYVDNALRDAHATVNPGYEPSKFFDIITNAMPSYFHANANNNVALMEAFLGRSQTYRQILSGFDRAQRAVVTGEEDNAWPAAF